MLTTHPHLVQGSRKRGAIPPLTPNAHMAYSGTNFTLLTYEIIRNIFDRILAQKSRLIDAVLNNDPEAVNKLLG
jgi:hypothetical protein